MRPLALILLSGHPILWLIVVALNFLPTIVAFARGHRHPGVILVLNLLFGWTGVGWVGCLIWAMVGRQRHRLDAPPPSW